MKEACKGGSVKKVPWLRPDLTFKMPPVGPEYGKIMVERVRKGLKKLTEEGKMDGEGVYLF